MKRIVCAIPLLLMICGCGVPTGDIEGQVLFKGKAMVAGTVTIIPAKGLGVSSPIENGAYQAKGLPLGDAKIVVVGPDQLPNPKWDKDAEPHVRRPDRDKPIVKTAPTPADKKQPLKYIYRTVETTPLTLTVKAGKNQHDINVD